MYRYQKAIKRSAPGYAGNQKPHKPGAKRKIQKKDTVKKMKHELKLFQLNQPQNSINTEEMHVTGTTSDSVISRFESLYPSQGTSVDMLRSLFCFPSKIKGSRTWDTSKSLPFGFSAENRIRIYLAFQNVSSGCFLIKLKHQLKHFSENDRVSERRWMS